MRRDRIFAAPIMLLLALWVPQGAFGADPLPSWNEGPAKKAIVEFVSRVTQEGGPDFVPAAERIAVLDNDGTLQCEQPMYVQLAFVLDRVKASAPDHPEWRTQQPFQAALEGDFTALATGGGRGLLEWVVAAQAGTTTEEYAQAVRDWLATARHPKFQRPYTELVYQPMLELLAHLRANGFKTYVVSGSGAEFLRPWTEKVYGIPPEQVIGSTVQVQYEVRDGKPALVRLPTVDFIDIGDGKPVSIYKYIGGRPIAAFGNSDGDFEMLEWTTMCAGARLGLIVHHDDSEREYAYDRASPFGKLVRALGEAPKRGWIVVNMKEDWRAVFPAREK